MLLRHQVNTVINPIACGNGINHTMSISASVKVEIACEICMNNARVEIGGGAMQNAEPKLP